MRTERVRLIMSRNVTAPRGTKYKGLLLSSSSLSFPTTRKSSVFSPQPAHHRDSQPAPFLVASPHLAFAFLCQRYIYRAGRFVKLFFLEHETTSMETIYSIHVREESHGYTPMVFVDYRYRAECRVVS